MAVVMLHKKRKVILLIIIALFGIICTTIIIKVRKSYESITIENEDQLAEAINDLMIRRAAGFDISFKAYTKNEEAVKPLIEELMTKSIYKNCGPTDGDYIRYQYGGYRMNCSVDKKGIKYLYTVNIRPIYYTTATEESEVDEILFGILSESDVDMKSPDYDKICFVHDKICELVEYDSVHKHTPGSGHKQSTAYGALKYHTALCQGYAVLCYRMFKELGVDCSIVTGKLITENGEERHAWNKVLLDGQYYNIDVTLDDLHDNKDYFLKSDEDFSTDHINEEDDF